MGTLRTVRCKLSYIVDLGSRTKSVHGFNYSAETWLWNTYLDIIDEQLLT